MGSRGWGAAERSHVCQAWHRAGEVKGLAPGIRAAEGEEQDKGIHREEGRGREPSPFPD
jgi:hypothetical protein